MNKQIWVGLAEVKPQPGCELLQENKGAFVHTMAWAENVEQFETVLALSCLQFKMDLTGVLHSEPWTMRDQCETESEELRELAKEIIGDVSKVAFGTFHAWFKDDLGDKQ